MEKINHSTIGIISQQQLMRELDCSRYFLFTLEKAGKLRKKYIRTKPYYLLEDVKKLIDEQNNKPLER